jgi:hypothetical protein
MIPFRKKTSVMNVRNHSESEASPKDHLIRINSLLKNKGIKKIFLFFINLVSAIALNSCETGDSESYKTCDDIKSGTSLFTKLKLNVIYDRVNYKHSQVIVSYANHYTVSYGWNGKEAIYDIIDGTKSPIQKSFIAAEAEGKNPTLSFKDVPDEYLTNILMKTDTYELTRIGSTNVKRLFT